jgi:hypothetical protein
MGRRIHVGARGDRDRATCAEAATRRRIGGIWWIADQEDSPALGFGIGTDPDTLHRSREPWASVMAGLKL